MDPRIVSAIESGFRAWTQGQHGDPDTMAVLELFVSRWDSGLELRDAELAFDVSVMAVAIGQSPGAPDPGASSDDIQRVASASDLTPSVTQYRGNQYRGVTMTGKQFVASQFFQCLVGIAETAGIPYENIRLLSRSGDSWWVYPSDVSMIQDIEGRQRTRSSGVVRRERIPA
jgi:hypothetical protein